MKPLRIGIFDNSFRGFDASITHLATLPPGLEYVDFPRGDALDGCDAIIATTDMARLLPPHRCRILWLQENREFRPHPPQRILDEFDFILTNDVALVDAMPKAVWMPPIGTWIAARADCPPKTKLVSYIASSKHQTSGHKMRHAVAAMRLLHDEDCYGTMFGKRIADKGEALWPYKFSITIEAASYAGYYTEKLWDCLATRTLPLYWGSFDLEPLKVLGIDTDGIIQFVGVDDLKNRIAQVVIEGDDLYQRMSSAIEHNYAAAWRYPCAETYLEEVLRKLGLGA